jgi:hypothetical protein
LIAVIKNCCAAAAVPVKEGVLNVLLPVNKAATPEPVKLVIDDADTLLRASGVNVFY